MPFPEQKTEWPPMDLMRHRQLEWEVWYSEDVAMLAQHYSRFRDVASTERFWSKARVQGQGGQRTRAVHLPVVSDMANTNAGLLFGESPMVNYDSEGEGGRRIEEFIAENALHATVIEAADMCSGLGGVYFKLDRDTEVSEVPVLSLVRPFQAIPWFRRRRLWEVLFWRTVKVTNAEVWRLLELRRREGTALVVEHRLYKGRGETIGEPVALDSIDETAMLDLEPVSTFAEMDSLGVTYIPNNLPNRLMPGSPEGIADSAPSVTLLDALDEAWSSWLHDIRLGRGRVLIDKEYLKNVDTGDFDYFRELFLPVASSELSLDPQNPRAGALPMQFELRVEEHLKTCVQLFTEIVGRAGYSPQSFGLGEMGQAESGTALRIRERKSQLTRRRKSRYWTAGMAELLWQMQRFDVAAELVGGSYDPVDVSVDLQDSITQDLHEDSETIRNLRMAEAMSRETAVRRAWPEWDDDQVGQELERLADEYQEPPPEDLGL